MATTTDATDFLNKLSNLGNLPNNAILVTPDVSSLYTNNPHNQGIVYFRVRYDRWINEVKTQFSQP